MHLKEASNLLELISSLTCKGFYTDQKNRLIPMNPSRVFNKDETIVLFFELNNLLVDIPINIELKYQDVPFFRDLSIVNSQNDGTSHCTFAYSINLDMGDIQSNQSFNVRVSTIDGNTLYFGELIIINNKNKINYTKNFVNNFSKIDFKN